MANTIRYVAEYIPPPAGPAAFIPRKSIVALQAVNRASTT